MRELPAYETGLVPMGNYVAEVTGGLNQRVSSFDNSKNYFMLPFRLTNENGEQFTFTWAFNSKSPMWGQFLLAIGGRKLPSNRVVPPQGSYSGRKVRVSIGQRTAKGSTDGRLINEVLAVYRYEEGDAESPINEAIKIPFDE
jgi:hypothetical protein